MDVKFPSRTDIRARLIALWNQTLSREDATAWALDICEALDDRAAEDPVAWRVLELMVGADMDGWEQPYLYGPENFAAWAAELSQDDLSFLCAPDGAPPILRSAAA